MIRDHTIEETSDQRKDPAYKSGWKDGRFGPTRPFLDNPNLARLSDYRERLAYYRGHREGRRVREKRAPEGAA